MQIDSIHNFGIKNISKPLPIAESKAAVQSTDTFAMSKTNSVVEKLEELKEKTLVKAAQSAYFPVLVAQKKVSETRAETLLELLQPGDLILETTQNRPFVKIAIKKATDSDYTHVSIYEGNGKKIEATVDHASGLGVDRKNAEEELNNDMVLFKVIRPPYQSQEDIDSALNYARSQIGKPFDPLFNIKSDKRMFCSELVTKALGQMPNPIQVPIRNILNIDVAVPQDLENIKDAQVLYDDNASFWDGMKSMFPSIGGGITFALGATALTLGPAGVVGALIGGTVITGLVGGSVQEKLQHKPFDSLNVFINFDNFDINAQMLPY